MAKIGSKIQETRLRKGLTLDRIADDTNISLRFLAKIENDDFTGFPGEPYIVGFIRNYAEYLGLDPEATVSLYRSKTVEASQSAQADAAAPTRAMSQEPTSLETSPFKASHLNAPPAKAPSAKAPEPVQTAKASPRVPEKRDEDPTPIQAEAKAGATNAAEQNLETSLEAEASDGAGETGEAAAPKPKKSRKAKAAAAANPLGDAVESKTIAAGKPKEQPKNADTQGESSPSSETRQEKEASSAPTLRSAIIGLVAVAIVGVALLWIVGGGKPSYPIQDPRKKEPTEYRVEGGPFETRLYVGDSLLIPLGDDVYKVRLASISETVNLETPFGPLQLALGESGPLDPDKNGSPDASLIVGDFEKNKPNSGALLKVEFSPPEMAEGAAGEITIPGTAAAAPIASTAAAQSPDTVIIKSSRGPYPFVVQVTFRGSCLFRYESDRKEWVEKYYSKGESLTINVASSLTVWTSNAQAVKLSFQASGGKTADLEIGAPGEIAVKRIAWARAEGSWALVSSNLD